MITMVAACQKANNVVIDSSQIINAQLVAFVGKDSIDIAHYHATTPPSFVISDSFLVLLSSVEGFSNLTVSVTNDSGSLLTMQSFTSLHGDSIGSSFYFAPSSVYVGYLTYTFTAYNNDGASGNYATKMVRLFNSANSLPVIKNIIAPDSIESGSTVDTLYAVVQDPNGLSDIQGVYFDVTLPNGNPATGNPHAMYDDGGASGVSNGDVDQKAGDGIYTLGISLSPSNPLGTYTFTFYAINRSGASSDSVSHEITIYR